MVGLGADEACTMLREAKLTPLTPDRAGEPSSGVVTAQEPVGGSGAPWGSSVVLWTRGGYGPSRATVPSDPVVGSKPLEPVG